MEKSFAFKPISIEYGTSGKKIEFKNRYMIPPMCSYSVDKCDGVCTPFHNIRYGSFAFGGFGGIITEVVAVEDIGRISDGDLGIWNDEQGEALRLLCEHVHSVEGAKIGIQIGHAGRRGATERPWRGRPVRVSNEEGGWDCVSCSSLSFRKEDPLPKALSHEEVHEIQKKFVDGCERAKKAGFDFIEIHGAHGYLINQFLCESTNLRTDEYGGSFENRCRFLLEIVEKVFERLGEFPVGVRLSSTEHPPVMTDDEKENERLRDFEKKLWTIDHTLKLVGELKKRGVFLIDCSSGEVNSYYIDRSIIKPGWQVEYSEAVKKAYGDSRLATTCVGEITEIEMVEEILKEGRADFVEIGRGALENPYIPIAHAKKLEFGVKDLGGMYVKNHAFALTRNWERQMKKE